jgi:DNA-binding NarL/FixJ family response regulator
VESIDDASGEKVDPIRVAIADDSFLMREALGEVLGRLDGVDVVAACEDGDALLDAVATLTPAVVITDLRMPPSGDAEGLRVATELRTRSPEVGVIVLSQFAEPRDVLAVLAGGASGRGYLLKDRVRTSVDLEMAIKAVARGGSVVDPDVVSLLLATPAGRPSALDDLTPRERDVMVEMAHGKSNVAIAESLTLSLRAVETYVGIIFRKLGLRGELAVSRRVAAVLMYLDESRG